MTDADFQKRVMVLCEEVLSIAEAERTAFLDTACADEPQLRTAVEKLMRTLANTSDFLTPVSEESVLEEGDQVGDYRIRRSLGRGGMGTVYLAERVGQGYSQQVALKIMRTHLRSSDMISRFNEERRILARLHHPYIARLMDGGTTEEGLPYLVTELIEGVPIDQYCREQRLSIRQRLELLQRVALGLQSAHQNLVVHSDLKPGNILVTEDGIPKLLDFGVARLAQASDAEREAIDTDSLVALTPEYASPEQLAGEPVTTVSDVYSLGVLTHVLLVGETPYPLTSASRSTLVQQLSKLPPVLASQHVQHLREPALAGQVADARRQSIVALAKALSGDLDAIVGKALSRAPTERYPSALVFANDLKHFCRGQPVLAVADSSAYRVKKFIGRNRFSVAAASLALLALCGGLAASLWQAHIAGKRFDDLHGFAETVIFDFHDEIADLPGGTAARQLMTRESLHYLDRLAEDAGGDVELQLDIARAYKRLGDVLGNPTNANLGDVGSAIDSYTKSLNIVENLSPRALTDAGVVRQTALVHEKLGDTLAWTGDLEGAATHAARSFAIFEQLLDTHPDKNQAIMSVAISGVKRGDLLGHPSFPNLGRQQEALTAYRTALDTITPLAEQADASRRTRRYHALIQERVGTMLSHFGDYEGALAHFRTSLELRELMSREDPGNANAQRDVAIAREKLGDVRLASGDASASLPYYEEALAAYRALSQSDPQNANASRTLAIGLENLADAYIALGNRREARVLFDELLTIREALVEQNPANERFRSELEGLRTRAEAL